MCGIVGCFPKNGHVTNEQAINAAKLLVESKVRGMHAYGVALCIDECWYTFKTFDVYQAIDWIKETPGLSAIIAHTRYDTSGDYKVLENNQPVVVGGDFLVFNGVIRQSTKEEYTKEFLYYNFQTENDGEIVLQMLQGKIDGYGVAGHLLKQPNVSYAGIQVVSNQVSYYRNERRPLSTYDDGQCFWIGSTIDILMRVFPSAVVCNVTPGVFHYVK